MGEGFGEGEFDRLLGFGIRLGDEDPAAAVVFELEFANVFVGTTRDGVFFRWRSLGSGLRGVAAGSGGQIGLENSNALFLLWVVERVGALIFGFLVVLGFVASFAVAERVT